MTKKISCLYLNCFLILAICISSFDCSNWKLRSLNHKKFSKVTNLMEIVKKAEPASDTKKTDKTKASSSDSDKTKKEDDPKKKEEDSTKNMKQKKSKKIEAKKAKREILKNVNPSYTAPDYTKASNIICTQNDNCQYPNYCSTDKQTCQCALNFAEYELNRPRKEGEKPADAKEIKLFCSYTRKSQLVYFLLEFILNMGAGHLYAGNNSIGAAKMTLVFLPCFVFWIMMCLGGSSKIAEMAVCGYCLVITAICAISIWWLVDVILISIGGYTDGNGVPLMQW
jgi:hypothetical protein